MSNTASDPAADRFLLGLTVGFIVAIASIGIGFALRPGGAGVWYGYGVVMGGLVGGTIVTFLVGYGVRAE